MYQFQFYKKSNFKNPATIHPRKTPALRPSFPSTHVLTDISAIPPQTGKMTVGQNSGLIHHSLCSSINFEGQGGCNPMHELPIMAF